MANEKGKRGPLSEADKKYIADYHLVKTPKAIATALNRDHISIKKYIKTKFGGVHQQSDTAHNTLKGSPIWDEIQSQFSDEEIKLFTYHYTRFITQFRDDVLPTEELQVVDLAKFEILMNRILTEEQNFNIKIQEMEQTLESLLQDKQTNRDEIMKLESKISIMRGGIGNNKKSYLELAAKKDNILKGLKATRESRIKHTESGKNNFGSWMRNLIDDKSRRDEVGEYIEKMRLATNVQYEKLSELHQYIDGQIDQPLLTPENVIGGPDEESTNNGN
jgi:hypothetical protein